VATPRILIWDLETSPNVVAKFSLREEYVGHTNILAERYIICAAWKELGAKGTQAVSVLDDPARYRKTPHDDKHVVIKLHKVLSEVDVVVAHNGDGFDSKWLNGRILFHGLPPLPPIKSVDTLKIARRMFNLNSNRLDYLGKYLGFGGKKSTPPGLWIDVLRGDAKAVKTMVDYNKRDVELLEQVFLKLRPYVPDLNAYALFGADSKTCPKCGSTNTGSRGWHASLTQVYRRNQCRDCHGWFRSRKSEQEHTAKVRGL
jgi:hypothetical protein